MTVCKTCKHANYCEIVAGGYSSQVKSCRDYRKGEMTNEEWIKSLDTEGLVDYLYEVHKGGNSVERQRWIENHKERVKMQFRGWLKEIHNE